MCHRVVRRTLLSTVTSARIKCSCLFVMFLWKDIADSPIQTQEALGPRKGRGFGCGIARIPPFGMCKGKGWRGPVVMPPNGHGSSPLQTSRPTAK
jgi:hypothetical protein